MPVKCDKTAKRPEQQVRQTVNRRGENLKQKAYVDSRKKGNRSDG